MSSEPVGVQPKAEDDRSRCDLWVLLTATTSDALAPFRDATALPHYADGPTWTVKLEAEIQSEELFDFAIVLCGREEEIMPSAGLVARLQSRRVAVALLVPESAERSLGTSDTYLAVLCPEDTSQGIESLCDILVSPVQQQGLVCCDWVDVSNILYEGAQARMWAVCCRSLKTDQQDEVLLTEN